MRARKHPYIRTNTSAIDKTYPMMELFWNAVAKNPGNIRKREGGRESEEERERERGKNRRRG